MNSNQARRALDLMQIRRQTMLEKSLFGNSAGMQMSVRILAVFPLFGAAF